jgi:hypothetical protein
MKKIKIKSEKQDNGLWGTPMNCYFMNSMSPIFDNRKHLLFSAILIAFAEEYNECSFRLDMMSDDGFLISINESLYNKVGGIGYNANFTKPDYLYITFNFLSKESWTNSGGHNFCTCILKDKSKVLVNWYTFFGKNHLIKPELKIIDIKFIRKLKIKNIEKVS